MPETEMQRLILDVRKAPDEDLGNRIIALRRRGDILFPAVDDDLYNAWEAAIDENFDEARQHLDTAFQDDVAAANHWFFKNRGADDN